MQNINTKYKSLTRAVNEKKNISSLPTVRYDLFKKEPLPRHSASILLIGFWNSVYIGYLVVDMHKLEKSDIEKFSIFCQRIFLETMPHALINAQLLSRQNTRKTSTLSFAIAICTADRPESLERCLKSFQSLSLRPSNIYVIDNSRKEPHTTKRVVEQHQLTYVREELPGLNRARNRALMVANQEIVIYTDDDVEVDDDWAYWMLSPFIDPLVMVSTGLVLPARLDTRSMIMSEYLCPHNRGPFRRIFEGLQPAGQAGVGASMAVNKAFFIGIGGFPEELDAGMPTGTGGDTWAFSVTLEYGYRIVYEPRALVYHWHRENEIALKRMIKANSAGTWGLFWEGYSRRTLLSNASYSKGLLRWHIVNIVNAARRNTNKKTYPLSLLTAELISFICSYSTYKQAKSITEKRSPAISCEQSSNLFPTMWFPDNAELDTQVIETGLTVSVIIPTRGRKLLVAELVWSILKTCSVNEVIVVIDGNIDDSVEYLNTVFSDEKLVIILALPSKSTQQDQGNGAGFARNAGARKAQCDVLVFLDDDVELLNAAIFKHHLAILSKSLNTISVGPALVDYRDSQSATEHSRRNWWVDHTTRLKNETQLGWPDICTGNLAIHRKYFLKIGAFSNLPRREDWEFGIRALSHGANIEGNYQAAVLQLNIPVQKFTMDRYRDGEADASIGRDHILYRYQILHKQDLIERRFHRVYQYISIYPEFFKNFLPFIVFMRTLLPTTRLKQKFEHEWRQCLYIAGKSITEGKLIHDYSHINKDIDPSLITSDSDMRKRICTKSLATGNYFRICFGSEYLGVYSSYQGGSPIPESEIESDLLNCYLHKIVAIETSDKYSSNQ